MNKTILHIGLHKTATTFFQNSVWPHVPGYIYLSRPFTQHNHAFNQMQYADDSLYNKRGVFSQLSGLNKSRLLISDEAFSGKPVFFSYINRSMIARRLKEIFPNAEIILFLRDQKDIILSHYSSYIKMPYGIKSIDKFLLKPENDFILSDYLKNQNYYNSKSLYYNTNDFFIHLDCFFYSPIINLYKSLFEKCHFFLYEDLVSKSESVFSRLEGILEEKIIFKDASAQNVSLSAQELETYRIANRLSLMTSNKSFIKAAQMAIKMLPIKKKCLKTVIDEYVGNYYHDDNNRLKSISPDLNWENHPSKYIC
jgi:hypothetical protein